MAKEGISMREVGAGPRWSRCAIAPAIAVVAFLLLVASASAATDYTWSGASSSSNWSDASNWSGGSAPPAGGSVGTLTFPLLAGAACAASPPAATCFASHDDLSGLSADALSIDDGSAPGRDTHTYAIDGNGITLGSGGLRASTTSSTWGIARLVLPVTLGASQIWSIDGNGGYGELELDGNVTGSTADTLGLTLTRTAMLDLLYDDVEAGPVTIAGGDTSLNGDDALDNGTVRLGGANTRLNATSGQPVTLEHAELGAVDTTVGPLTSTGGSLAIGVNGDTGALHVAGSATLDSTSVVKMTIDQSGTTPLADYSQLTATGNVDLGGAALELSGDDGYGACPSLSAGDVDTLVTTPGALSGSFRGIADGQLMTLACRSTDPPTVRIDYTGSGVTATVVSPGTPPPTIVSWPTISGTAQQNRTLTVSGGYATNNPTYSYQWARCDSAGNACSYITGATSQTYALTVADVGYTIRMWMTAQNAGGSDTEESGETALVRPDPLAPSNISPPVISGTAQAGQTLTEGHGAWTNSPTGYSYQWQTCDASGHSCSSIPGATSQTYTLGPRTVGRVFRVQESASNASAVSGPATSAATGVVASAPGPVNTGPPKIIGKPQQGQILSELHGTWTRVRAYAYQWQRCDSGGQSCTPIPGAVGQAHNLVAPDVGHTIRVVETATDLTALASATSSPTGVVHGLPAGRPAPRRFTIGERVRYSRTRVTLTSFGRITLPRNVSRARGCRGTVRITALDTHNRPLAGWTARVRRDCTYRASGWLRRSRLRHARIRRLRVRTRFLGNAVLRPQRSRTLVLGVRP